ncbi:MAG: M67 family metallopeptidase [Aquificae bacterium]|nr:M67 family metallopeptidase [Aquificota bacterium]
MLKIKRSELEKLLRQAERDYPYETCGLLLGRREGDARVVYEVFETPNANKERRRDRYEISPHDYLKAEDYALEKGLEIVGVYHSHPDHPDRPSRFDLERAFPELSYLIVSVRDGKAVSYRSWELENEAFKEEEVLVWD